MKHYLKQIAYVAAFVFLGLLVAALIHAGLEIPTLLIITGDIDRYGESWLWQNWRLVHGLGGGLLWLAGAGVGYWLGRRYWRIVYIEKARRKPFDVRQ